MAATEPTAVPAAVVPAVAASPALQALTRAALLLPGLLLSSAHAAEPADSITLQHSRYSEGKRQLLDVPSSLPTLTADTLAASGNLTLPNGYTLSANVTLDSWSGATPVATAPLLAGSNRPVRRNTPTGVITSGASPLLNGTLLLDSTLQPVSSTLQPDTRSVLIMSAASPEVRKQVDAVLRRDGRGWSAHTGAGVSTEPDFLSRFLSAGGSVDFNQQLTRVNVDISYTHNNTHALLDADALPYLTRSNYAAQLTREGGSERLRGTRSDRSISAGWSQVINATTQLDLIAGITQSQGFMENPYKATSVIFIGDTAFSSPATASERGDVRALLEQRPDRRIQRAVSSHLAHHFPSIGASLHLDYRYTQDDWGSISHTAELEWVQPLGAWRLVPYLRGYRQSASDFYTPYLVSAQHYRRVARDDAGRELWRDADQPGTHYSRTGDGNFIDDAGHVIDVAQRNLQPQWQDFSAALLPAHFSSDHRLAAFDTVSAGLLLSRQFARGLVIEGGLEYYRRDDNLFGGNHDDNGFADVDALMASLSLRVDLQASARRLRRENQQHATHTASHGAGHTFKAPAGLMFAHPTMSKGSFMTGYRFASTRQYGDMLHGRKQMTDAALTASACGVQPCRETPSQMAMGMHMLDISYAVTDQLTLLLMPQFMTMTMQARKLPGADALPPAAHVHGEGEHASSGRGDTLTGLLWQLRSTPGHTLQAGLVFSIPTGKVDLGYLPRFGNLPGLRHPHMQAGSGTWDLLPSLTYSGTWHHGYWGMQLSGTARLQQQNKIGYRLGNIVQYSAWTGYDLTPWLSASVRAGYTRRGGSRGAITSVHAESNPLDFLANQGGSLWVAGLGLQASLAGSELALEWSLPVRENLLGVQLQSQQQLSASWQYGF